MIGADSGDPSAVMGAVERTVGELGRLDILVNNAGVFPIGPLEEVTLEEIQRTLAVHTVGSFVAAQAAARHMTAGGRIISIGSCFAERVPYSGVTLYAMSKAALIGLTKGLARDLGGRGINATVVHPGSTDTEMNPANGAEADGEREYIALGRYASPNEVAATVAALAGTAVGTSPAPRSRSRSRSTAACRLTGHHGLAAAHRRRPPGDRLGDRAEER